MESFWKIWRKRKIHFKEIPLTPTPLVFHVYHCSKEQFNELLTTKYGLEQNQLYDKIKASGAITIFINNSERTNIIVAVFENSIYNACHEAVHVSWFLQHMTGFKFNYDNQETQAYYVSHVAQEIGKFLKNVT